MKISIDATGIRPHKTGTVTYLVEILRECNADKSLEHTFIIFCATATRHHFDELELDSRFQLKTAPKRKLQQMLWQQTGLPYYLWRHGIDVHWGPGFVLPLLAVCPMVVTVHDMTFELFPEVHEPIKRFYFPFMIRRAVKRATNVLVISKSTANDIERLIPASRGKTVVTYLAARCTNVSPEDTAQAAQTTAAREVPSTPYVLFIGTLEPRKNLQRLIQAWAKLGVDVRGEHRLIVVGLQGWMVQSLQSQAGDSVLWAGHLSDEALQRYLRHATCFVYPTLYEGFGLPVVEAMAAGVPVLTSDIGATAEIARDAALLIDPTSLQSIEHGLTRLLQEADLRQQLAAAGLQRAARFSWKRTAQLTCQTLSDAADK